MFPTKNYPSINPDKTLPEKINSTYKYLTMSFNRKQIVSDRQLLNGLSIGNTRMGYVDVSLCPYDTETRLLLTDLLPQFLEQTATFNTNKSRLNQSNKNLDATELVLKNYCSSYLELVNLKIKDGFYPKFIRKLFGLDMKTGALPYMDTLVALRTLADTIIIQDAQFALKGLRLMEDYNVVEMGILLADVQLKSHDRSVVRELKGKAQTELKSTRKSCLTLLTSMWNQTEFFYRLEKKPAMRKDSGRWGVEYEQSKIVTIIAVQARFKATGKIAPYAQFRIGKLQTERKKVSKEGVRKAADIFGIATLMTTQKGALFLIGDLPGFKRSITPLAIVVGVNQTLTVRFEKLPAE